MLRDWTLLPCPEVEEWLKVNVLPHYDELADALGRIAMPATILDQEPVKEWFSQAEAMEKKYCDSLRPLITQQSLGFAGSNPITAEDIVSHTKSLGHRHQSPRSHRGCVRQSAFEAMCDGLDMQCEPLHAWLKDAHDSGKAMALDPPNSLHTDTADSPMDCTATSTTEPDGSMNDEVSGGPP